MAVRPQLVVVGSLNRDVTVEVPRLPVAGETVLGTAHRWDSGGKGANQAVAAARLGTAVAMVGRVGADDAGDVLVAALGREGIDVSHVGRDHDVGTGLAAIVVDAAGENQIVVSPGANGRVGEDDLPAALLAGATVTLVQLEVPVPTVAAAVRLAGGTVILNPAPPTDVPAALLGAADVLVPNRSELAWLAGAPEPTGIDEAAVQARSLGGTVVVTLGADGALLVDAGDATHVPAPAVDAVDTTAAGDAFCGALAAGLVRGDPMIEATRQAVAAGAVTASRPGAQASLPSGAEVEAMLARMGPS